jgi:hypothetical protein
MAVDPALLKMLNALQSAAAAPTTISTNLSVSGSKLTQTGQFPLIFGMTPPEVKMLDGTGQNSFTE